MDQGIRQGPHVLHTARPHGNHVHRSALDEPPACGDPIHSGGSRRRRHAECANDEADEEVTPYGVAMPDVPSGMAGQQRADELTAGALLEQEPGVNEWNRVGGRLVTHTISITTGTSGTNRSLREAA